jgi:hypothetical protein
MNMDLYFDWIWLNCKSDAETLTQLAMTCFVFLCSEFSQSSQPRSACSKELLSSTVIVQRNLANLPCLFSIHARHGFCHRAISSMPSWDTEVTSYSDVSAGCSFRRDLVVLFSWLSGCFFLVSMKGRISMILACSTDSYLALLWILFPHNSCSEADLGHKEATLASQDKKNQGFGHVWCWLWMHTHSWQVNILLDYKL